MHSPLLFKFNISMVLMKEDVDYCFYFFTTMPRFDVRDKFGGENREVT